MLHTNLSIPAAISLNEMRIMRAIVASRSFDLIPLSPFSPGSLTLNSPLFRVELFHTRPIPETNRPGTLQMDISWRRTKQVGGWHGEYVATYETNQGSVAIAAHMAQEIIARTANESTIKLATDLVGLTAWLIPPVVFLCKSPMGVATAEVFRERTT